MAYPRLSLPIPLCNANGLDTFIDVWKFGCFRAGVIVTGVIVTGVLVTGVIVTGVRVTGVRVTGVRVTGVRVTGVIVTGVRVTGVIVTGVIVTGVIVTLKRNQNYEDTWDIGLVFHDYVKDSTLNTATSPWLFTRKKLYEPSAMGEAGRNSWCKTPR